MANKLTSTDKAGTEQMGAKSTPAGGWMYPDDAGGRSEYRSPQGARAHLAGGRERTPFATKLTGPDTVSSATTVVAMIDDDEVIRGSLARLMASAGIQAQVFASARQFLEGFNPGAVCCVITDLWMPDMNGLQLQEALLRDIPYLSMIFITGDGDIAASVRAMKAGAVDFLEKPIEWRVLLEAIQHAIERSTRLRAEAAELAELKRRQRRLTPRERDVFALVSVGLLNKQVAAELGAAEKTIKQHRGVIMRKMQAESLSHLVLMAERLGIRPTGHDFMAARGRLSPHPNRGLLFAPP